MIHSAVQTTLRVRSLLWLDLVAELNQTFIDVHKLRLKQISI